MTQPQIFERVTSETYHVVSCFTCSVKFGIPEQLYNRVVRLGIDSVYCPACGKQTAWRTPELVREKQRLEAELATANRRADTAKRHAETQERLRIETANKLRATKGVVTKIKKRVHNGVCPCCSRHFENLQRHMQTKHPDFVEQKENESGRENRTNPNT